MRTADCRKYGASGRFLAFFLACILFCAELGFPASANEVGDLLNGDGSAEVWEWTPITKQEDIPSNGVFPILICYRDEKGNEYYLRNGDIAGERELHVTDIHRTSSLATPYIRASKISDGSGISLGSETFYTGSLPSQWEMKAEKGTKNSCRTIRLRCGDTELSRYIGVAALISSIAKSRVWQEHEAGNLFSVYTKDVGGDRADYTADGCVQLYYDNDEYRNSIDVGLCYEGDFFGAVNENSKKYSSFYLYYGRKMTFSSIDDTMVLHTGSTYYAQNNLILNKNVTMVIEPGAVLYVDGVFNNKGIICNCGTIVVNHASGIFCSEENDPESGVINCYGGDNVRIQASNPYEWVDLDELEEEYTYESQMYARSSCGLFYLIEDMELELEELLLEVGEEDSSYRAKYEEYSRKKEQYQKQIDEYDRKLEELQRDYKEMLKRIKDASEHPAVFTYDGCDGYLLVMSGGVLSFPHDSFMPLNLYHDSVLVNNGLIILPSLLYMDNADFINRTSGDLFIGYTYSGAADANLAGKLKNRTISPSLSGMSQTKSETGTALMLDGVCHISNQGYAWVVGRTDAYDFTMDYTNWFQSIIW